MACGSEDAKRTECVRQEQVQEAGELGGAEIGRLATDNAVSEQPSDTAGANITL